jgi:transcriptional regulator with XRE-family HTH domain
VNHTTALIGRLLSAGLTQAEIARRAGIPQPRLSKWTRGQAPKSADDALALIRLEEAVTRGPVSPDALPPPAGQDAELVKEG